MRDDSRTEQKANDQASARDAQPSPLAPPSLSLPKGGGAIRGIGEKFAANPVTGTGSMSVPIAVSPGRGGFGPQLALSYDSGAGNGPFGLGWNLSLPAITRKTDKGLAKYQDADESDVFILSGAEDLVPELELVKGKWERKKLPPRTVANSTYVIHLYRPRIEGLFARIERWTDTLSGATHWRSTTKDNLLTIYGLDEKSRIADPLDARRVFSWLICETRDDKGNGVVYEYVAENATEVDLTQVNERNRGSADSPLRKGNRYIKYIRYGNSTPLLDGGKRPPFLSDVLRNKAGWMFQVVFDYGDEDYTELPEDNQKRRFVETSLDKSKSRPWPVRTDPFSSYRSGFEVRTYRLCQRVLMFHHFDGEEGVGRDCLVRSTDFTYQHNHIASFIESVEQTGYQRRGAGYLKQSVPPLQFTYTEARINDEVQIVDAASLENLPAGLDGAQYQWVDLDGEGVTGILTEQGTGWFYKRNLSPLTEK